MLVAVDAVSFLLIDATLTSIIVFTVTGTLVLTPTFLKACLFQKVKTRIVYIERLKP